MTVICVIFTSKQLRNRCALSSVFPFLSFFCSFSSSSFLFLSSCVGRLSVDTEGHLACHMLKWQSLYHHGSLNNRVKQTRKKNTNIVYECTYIEFRKMAMITLYEKQQKRHRHIEQSFGLCGRRRGWDDLRK